MEGRLCTYSSARDVRWGTADHCTIEVGRDFYRSRDLVSPLILFEGSSSMRFTIRRVRLLS